MSQAFLGGSEPKYLKKANSKVFLTGLYTSNFQILYLGLCLHPQLIKSSAEGLKYRYLTLANELKVMRKILQARLQQYVNCELPDVQAGFRKGRGTRDQIANICWIMEKAKEFQKNISFCFIDYAKAFDYVDDNKLENSERDGNTRPPDLPLEKSVCRSGSNS